MEDRHYYAIMADDICVGILDTFDEMVEENYMQLQCYDDSILGKVRIGEGWVETSNNEEVEESDDGALDDISGYVEFSDVFDVTQEEVDEMVFGQVRKIRILTT